MPENFCQECEKPIRGRADKKFCDDYCRNNFNNRKNSASTNLIRNINNALKKNRRLMHELLPEGEELTKCPRQKLADLGFDFTHQTHIYVNQKGNTYYFCYDMGYLPLEKDWVLIVQRKDNSRATS